MHISILKKGQSSLCCQQQVSRGDTKDQGGGGEWGSELRASAVAQVRPGGSASDFETRSMELVGCFGFVEAWKVNRVLRKIFSVILRSLQDSGEIRWLLN